MCLVCACLQACVRPTHAARKPSGHRTPASFPARGKGIASRVLQARRRTMPGTADLLGLFATCVVATSPMGGSRSVAQDEYGNAATDRFLKAWPNSSSEQTMFRQHRHSPFASSYPRVVVVPNGLMTHLMNAAEQVEQLQLDGQLLQANHRALDVRHENL